VHCDAQGYEVSLPAVGSAAAGVRSSGPPSAESPGAVQYERETQCDRRSSVAPVLPDPGLAPQPRGFLARSTICLSRIEAHEPDAAWAMYRHLDGRTQQYIAEHVSEKRWSELLLREIEDRVLRDTAPPQRSHRDAIAEELCDGLNRHVRNKAIGETPPANWLAYELGDRKFRVSPDRAIAREERPDGAWPLIDTEYVLMHARRSATPESRAWVQRLVASLKPPVT